MSCYCGSKTENLQTIPLWNRKAVWRILNFSFQFMQMNFKNKEHFFFEIFLLKIIYLVVSLIYEIDNNKFVALKYWYRWFLYQKVNNDKFSIWDWYLMSTSSFSRYLCFNFYAELFTFYTARRKEFHYKDRLYEIRKGQLLINMNWNKNKNL